MKKHVSMGLVSAAVAALFAVASPTFATPVTQTINLGQVYTGATPDGAPPWLTATFAYDDAGGSNSGTLTLISHLTNGNFLQGGGPGNGVFGWGFNIGGNTLDSLNCTAGTCANKAVTEADINSGPVGGGFNLGFGWNSKNRFGTGDTATYTLTFDDALTTSPFVANADGFFSFAHVQGIPDGGSGYIVTGNTPPTVPIPEPGALGMLGLGTLLLGGFIGLRRRFS